MTFQKHEIIQVSPTKTRKRATQARSFVRLLRNPHISKDVLVRSALSTEVKR